MSSFDISPILRSVVDLYAVGRTRIVPEESKFKNKSGSSYDEGGVSEAVCFASGVPTWAGINVGTPGFLVRGRSKTTVLESESTSALLSEDITPLLFVVPAPLPLASAFDLAFGVSSEGPARGIAFGGVCGGCDVTEAL